ncbi:MEDS domain-containing protein [Streptomyces sp. CB03234]|uniref:MEDS domain-containing protein n=1 Tax=Streptomyces sp. (strain CB03234) TaxID=1703937 RepID=UPI00117DF6A5|nr:MEDS domain-containing protein [Streptomyces sp. CB03234]
MLASEEHHPGTLPVQHMGSGHHAFLCYDDDAPGWDVLAAFVWSGLARGEKVIVFGPPRLTEAQVRSRLQEAPGLLVASGYERAQLELSSMRELILPARRFTADRQWQRIVEESETARDEGYTGLRTYIDMGWVADLGADLDMMMDRERRAGHLFTDGFYSEICAYDRRRFPEPVLDAMCRAHPQNLLPRIGHLRCRHDNGTLQVIGEADVATYGQFAQALADLLRTPAPPPGLSTRTVDLLRTGFLGAECATELVRLLDRAPADRPVRIRCSERHATLLCRIGADPAALDVTG